MPLGTVFQVSIYGLACFSSVILAVAHGSAFPQALTVPFGLSALFFTERWKKIQLSPLWANLLGLLAFVVATFEFFSEDLEARLISGAHLLVYLSWIVLFQEKTPRQYWWMCALGVLQVAVASVLSESAGFGMLLALYLLCSIWTLSVYSLYRARQQFADAEQYATFAHNSGLAKQPAAPISAGSGMSFVAPVGAAALTMRAFGPSMTRGSIQHDVQEQWINLRFIAGVLMTSLLALVVGGVFFLFIPRVWVGKQPLFRSQPLRGTRPLTGFTEEVRLGDMGEILESSEQVLEVRFFDQATNKPIDVDQFAYQMGLDEPLFRGTVLGEYRNGRWRPSSVIDGFNLMPTGSNKRNLIRQEIRMGPIGTRIVFAVHPVVACRLPRDREGFNVNPVTGIIVRSEKISASAPLSYLAFSVNEPNRGNAMPTAMQHVGPLGFYAREVYLSYPRNELRKMRDLSHQLIAVEEGAADLDDQQKAEKLVQYLRDSGEYSYTLDASIQDSLIDPLEDFLFNRKQGHCEYFASALTLMLRSVGVPSRLITGFKGGDKYSLNSSYVVQQRHAHAWVEAYIDNRWVVLDATPSGRSESVKSLAPSFPTWANIKQAFSELWSQNVVQLSLSQQRNQFYNPLQETARNWWNPVEGRWTALKNWLAQTLTSPEMWFSWRGWVAAFVLLWGGLLSYKIIRRIIRFILGIPGRLRAGHRARANRVEFYDRFQKVMRRVGMLRSPAQTQWEFAEQVQYNCSDKLAGSSLNAFPQDLAESFYRIRFGNEVLPPEEIRRINQRLDDLEARLELATKS